MYKKIIETLNIFNKQNDNIIWTEKQQIFTEFYFFGFKKNVIETVLISIVKNKQVYSNRIQD